MNASQEMWLDAPQHLSLTDGEVHVWRASTHQDEAALLELWESLSADERERAGRFHFGRDRQQYIAARGVLRDILGRYTGLAPRLMRFSYDRYNKPALSVETGGGSLQFNVSHSHDLALYALTSGREVGVDIEFMREGFAGLEIAESFFSPREVSALRALPPGERAVAFFDCWTRKEAYIKARGEGLSYPLQLFTVSLAPGEPAALLCTEDDPQEAARWSLLELFPGEGYRATLAVKGEVTTLHCWRWPSA